MEKNLWVQSVLQALAGLSRTLGGVSDTSSSEAKPKLSQEGEGLASKTSQNLGQALEVLWGSKNRAFVSPVEMREFVDLLARIVSDGLLQPGQGLYRTWETKFKQTSVEQLEAEYQKFCDWLFQNIDCMDAVKTAALVEKRLDAEIHPFADGCGRTSKILSAFVLLRHGFMPPAYRSRVEYYATITKSDAEWVFYYRSFYKV